MYAGETEEQYLATERLVREVGFDRVNTAAYSPRPNTPAAEWDNQVRGSCASLQLGMKSQVHSSSDLAIADSAPQSRLRTFSGLGQAVLELGTVSCPYCTISCFAWPETLAQSEVVWRGLLRTAQELLLLHCAASLLQPMPGRLHVVLTYAL
jgi:hypothetical protein